MAQTVKPCAAPSASSDAAPSTGPSKYSTQHPAARDRDDNRNRRRTGRLGEETGELDVTRIHNDVVPAHRTPFRSRQHEVDRVHTAAVHDERIHFEVDERVPEATAEPRDRTDRAGRGFDVDPRTTAEPVEQRPAAKRSQQLERLLGSHGRKGGGDVAVDLHRGAADAHGEDGRVPAARGPCRPTSNSTPGSTCSWTSTPWITAVGTPWRTRLTIASYAARASPGCTPSWTAPRRSCGARPPTAP